jgi:hypothetical protein
MRSAPKSLFATEDPTFFGTEFEYATHNLEAGIRIGF